MISWGIRDTLSIQAKKGMRMRAKEWLLSNGHIEKIGRGRISLKNHERLAESGEKFSDWPKGKVTETAATGTSPKVVRVVRDDNALTETAWLSVDEYRFPENLYKAVADDGTVYGMREACNMCGYSLCGHICESPSVLGNPVRIELR